MKVIAILLLTAALLIPIDSSAETYVKLSVGTQDYKNTTPLDSIQDTLSWAVEAGTFVGGRDRTQVGVRVQSSDEGGILSGVSASYSLHVRTPVQPYVGFGFLVNIKELTDEGLIASGHAGLNIDAGSRARLFVEARSLSWFIGDKRTNIGASAGVSLLF